MRVQVLFFGLLKDLAGTSSDVVELPEPAFVNDLLAYYRTKIPGLKTVLDSTAVALNQRYASVDSELRAGDEVALLPPVSGGSAEAGQRHSRIIRSRIDTEETVAQLKRGEDGAALTFEGIVRNQTRGRKTLYLDYEAYELMAEKELESLATEALRRFEIRDVALVHRLGRLEIGETSVLVAVASAHRAAAFEACRWLIDTLKRTVPIWKKEYFEDGAVWADGEPFPDTIARANSSPAGSPVKEPASK